MEQYLYDLRYHLVLILMAGVVGWVFERLLKKEDSNIVRAYSEARTDIYHPLFNYVVFLPLAYLMTASMEYWHVPFHTLQGVMAEQNLFVQMIVALLVLDFFTYWRHRFNHAYMWQIHSVHHSAEHLTFLTNFRMHFLDFALSLIVSVVALYVLGFSGVAIVFAGITYELYSSYIHFNIKLDYPAPIKYIFGSPQLHRWHHAKDRKAMDKNFCIMFSLYDVIFGTFYSPKEGPKQCGIFERKDKKMPDTFWGQVLYPFK